MGISSKEMKISKKKKNAFSHDHMLTSWFKFQLDSSSGVGCSESAYIHTHIHTYIYKSISGQNRSRNPEIENIIFREKNKVSHHNNMFSALRLDHLWHRPCFYTSVLVMSSCVYFRVFFLRCIHLLPMSVRLLMRVPLWRFFIINSFSDRHKSQARTPGSYTEHLLRKVHVNPEQKNSETQLQLYT